MKRREAFHGAPGPVLDLESRSSMSAEKSDQASTFDLEKFRELVELMEKHDLSDVSLKGENQHWRVKRGAEQVIPHYAMPQMPAAAPAPVAPAVPAGGSPAAAPEAANDPNVVDIVSPTVGTFYESPSPDDPAFVKVGSKVSADTTVCLIEAMKVFNQIQAEVSGTIVEVLVKSGDAIDFGQPLFKVKIS
ncbi:Acetyl-CoA biotin carboxyl carrier [Polystyrenella longa]|uniref:Biotin carboxyl carrier protein of acetyl-CoA carboxylase n=2 Tax=Polystyrenella longa TaxID=2528007 RepID=A0A518CU06_9PLAN|nr:Acetyl-CoA biotin carboxyl carrier [Polystyrenella longa]